jgi:hypothetical protein
VVGASSVAIFSILHGCGGGDGIVTPPAPADVAGIWTVTYNNVGSAVFTGCTGDLEILNGVSVATLLVSVSCSFSGPLTVSQSGSSFTFERIDYLCDTGDYGFIGGGGSVNGNSLTGQLDEISQAFGVIRHYPFSGVMTGPTTISASVSRVSVSGAFEGQCMISPPLSISVEISAGLASSNRASGPNSRGESFGLAGWLAEGIARSNMH